MRIIQKHPGNYYLRQIKKNIRLIIVRASDVPTYVEWGGADMGIAGKDVLDEFQGKGLFQPLDLGIGKCELMVAAKKDFNYEACIKQKGDYE